MADYKLSDDKKLELASLLDSQHAVASDTLFGDVGFRAAEGYDYYYGKKPLPVTRGGSKYVDRTVWDSVNGTLQDVLNVFANGERPVKLTPQHANDAVFMQGVNEAINDVLLRQNEGYSVLHDTFKEALITRIGFVKRYWCQDQEVIEEDFEDLTEEELAQYIGERGADVVSAIEGKDKNLSGKISYVIDRSKVKLEYTPMEEVFVNPEARSIRTAKYVDHRTKKTYQEVIDMFDLTDDKLDEIFGGSDNSEWTQLSLARNDFISSEFNDWLETGGVDKKTNECYLHEHYVRTSIPSKDGEVHLYQVFAIGNNIIECNRVREIPFSSCTPFPMPGSVWGESVFDITKDIQNIKTALMRGYIDNINSANYGRYMGVKGAYNVRSLLDNRPGTVVEMNAPGMVDLFPHRPLPQGIDNLLMHVEQQKESRTGVSKTSQGLNENIFKNDNAYDTVSMVMSAAQNRMRMIARNIAQTFMKDLIISIYELLRENSTTPIEVDTPQGRILTIPQMWPGRYDVEIAVAVGSNERQERANSLTALKQLLESDGRLQGAFGLEEDHRLVSDIAEAMGVMDHGRYIKPLDQIEPPQPDPMQIAQLQLVQAQTQDLQANSQKKMADAQISAMKGQFEQEFAADEMDLKQSEAMANQLKASAELKLAQAKLLAAQQEMQLAAQKAGMDYARMSSEAQVAQEVEADKMFNEERKIALEAEKIALERQKMFMDAALTRQTGEPQGIGTTRED